MLNYIVLLYKRKIYFNFLSVLKRTTFKKMCYEVNLKKKTKKTNILAYRSFLCSKIKKKTQKNNCLEKLLRHKNSNIQIESKYSSILEGTTYFSSNISFMCVLGNFSTSAELGMKIIRLKNSFHAV